MHERPEAFDAAGSKRLLADVLSGEDPPTRLAFEAGEVPLALQGQQRLALLDLQAAASAVWRRRAQR